MIDSRCDGLERGVAMMPECMLSAWHIFASNFLHYRDSIIFISIKSDKVYLLLIDELGLELLHRCLTTLKPQHTTFQIFKILLLAAYITAQNLASTHKAKCPSCRKETELPNLHCHKTRSLAHLAGRWPFRSSSHPSAVDPCLRVLAM